MTPTRWDSRFFSTTRGRIVQLVRGAPRTVDELAQALGLTDNAVRAHLATLDRDGLVHQAGERRGGGKPSLLYETTEDAERLFPKAYGPVLGTLLGTLDDQLSPDAFESTLREVGHRLAEGREMPDGSPVTRARAAATILEKLGAAVSVEETPEGAAIHGASCPLAGVVIANPGACRILEALLSELTGLEVRESCNRTGPPRCCFEVLGDAA